MYNKLLFISDISTISSKFIEEIRRISLVFVCLITFPQLLSATPFPEVRSSAMSIPVAIEGNVTLQGRPPAPAPSWAVSLEVGFYLEGDDFATATFNVMTDQSGIFTIPDTQLNAGNYVVTVKNTHTLLVAYAATLIEGSNVIDFGTLPEGDANNSNSVTIADFSILSATFNLGQGQVGYDDRADFNEDNGVTISDFSLLSVNFNQSGYTVTTNSYSELLAAQGGRTAGVPRNIPFYGNVVSGTLSEITTGKVDMWLETEEYSETLRVKVMLGSGDQPLDAAQTELRYDANSLSLQMALLTGDLPMELMKEYTPGWIRVASGTIGNLPRGTVQLLTLEFKVKGPLSGNAVELIREGSAVTYAGREILGEIRQGEIMCSECTTQVMLYPNPGDGLYRISGMGAGAAGSRYTVLDMRGQLIKEIELNQQLDQPTIDLRGLPTGMYLLQVESGDSRSIHKIIKN